MNQQDPTIQQWLREIKSDGFCVLDGVIPHSECRAIEDQLISVARRQRNQGPYEDQLVSFVPGLLNFDASLAPYLADPRVLALCEMLLGANFRISFVSLTINEPGKTRTNWHSDWPFNQNSACHISTPYPDRIMHLTALFMINQFTDENGGTLVVPGSHRHPSNPSDEHLEVDPMAPYPGERHIIGNAGSLVILDSRLWHCGPANSSNEPRVAVAVRYAPWWLNLEALDPDSDLRRQLVIEPGRTENTQSRISRTVYHDLPDSVKPLLRHWVKGNEE